MARHLSNIGTLNCNSENNNYVIIYTAIWSKTASVLWWLLYKTLQRTLSDVTRRPAFFNLTYYIQGKYCQC
jgi:hypothetical protein